MRMRTSEGAFDLIPRMRERNRFFRRKKSELQFTANPLIPTNLQVGINCSFPASLKLRIQYKRMRSGGLQGYSLQVDS